MVKVLLVDDQHQTARNLGHAFGEHNVTWVTDPDEAVCRLTSSEPQDLPDAVFIDYDFREPDGPAFGQATGFTVFLALHELKIDARAIAFTTLQEDGRALYAIAAHRWLGASALIDKSATDAQLNHIVRSPDVSLYPGWRSRVRLHAHLLDGLFPTRSSIDMWRVWQQAQGDSKAIGSLAHVGRSTVNQFSSLVVENVLAVQEHLLGRPFLGAERGNKNLRGPISELASSHSQFFRAPELPRILELAQPWARR